METGIYLTALVLGVGAVDLAMRTASYFSLGQGKSSSKTKRDDWYMFFHMSDLTGEKMERKDNSSNAGIQSTNRTTSRKRPAARMQV